MNGSESSNRSRTVNRSGAVPHLRRSRSRSRRRPRSRRCRTYDGHGRGRRPAATAPFRLRQGTGAARFCSCRKGPVSLSLGRLTERGYGPRLGVAASLAQHRDRFDEFRPACQSRLRVSRSASNSASWWPCAVRSTRPIAARREQPGRVAGAGGRAFGCVLAGRCRCRSRPPARHGWPQSGRSVRRALRTCLAVVRRRQGWLVAVRTGCAAFRTVGMRIRKDIRRARHRRETGSVPAGDRRGPGRSYRRSAAPRSGPR
jgi:hypothetical protein